MNSMLFKKSLIQRTMLSASFSLSALSGFSPSAAANSVNSVPATPAANTTHSKVMINDDVKAATLSFRIIADDGYDFNFDAPWSLKVKSTSTFTFAQDTYASKDLDQKLTGFKVKYTQAKTKEVAPAAQPQAAGSDYELIAFICTKDKKQCFRDKLTGSISVKTNAVNDQPRPAQK